MGFKRFTLAIVIRTIAAMVTLTALAWCLMQPGYHAMSILLLLALGGQLFSLIRLITRTNNEIVRFFDAARHADYSQRFDLSKLGAGFDELGKAFSDILSQLQKARNQQEEHLRHVKAVIEHVPVPLISIQSDQQITLWNNSARRLFGTHGVTKLSDLDQFHPSFAKQLTTLMPGERSLVTITIDGMQHQLSISATQVIVAQKQELLISLQDIQSELDTAQLEAWQDLVKVLTHEIMNSITPVASLAQTAVDLVNDVTEQVSQHSKQYSEQYPDQYHEIIAELNDVNDAVTTVARRSDNLMQFVTSYRRLTRLPPPNKRQVSLANLLSQVERIACQQWPEYGISLASTVTPSSLTVQADAEMIEQVLINLLRNAEQALRSLPKLEQGNLQQGDLQQDKQQQDDQHQEYTALKVTLSAFINSRGHVVIEVFDNGPGINADIAEKVFVPFFTTKKEGSGVGLALTRQVMLAHGGYVTLQSQQGAGTQQNVGTQQGVGTKFSLVF
ncbi:sensor histidine kinase [Colwellia sp. MEBiC06753]